MSKESMMLTYKDAVSDKFYEISIEEVGGAFDVPFRFGRTGTNGQSGFKAQGVTYEEAKKAFDKSVKEKLKKDYKPQ